MLSFCTQDHLTSTGIGGSQAILDYSGRLWMPVIRQCALVDVLDSQVSEFWVSTT